MPVFTYKTGEENLKLRLERLRSQLENERSTFLSHWRTLGDFILPRRLRFEVTDTNRGDRRNQNIIDSTATLAARTLSSGMMSGITSPARPWFRLTTRDADLRELSGVQDWLHFVTQRMIAIFLKSNLYNTLPTIYKDLGVFGTACMFVEEDFDDVLRTYAIPIGSYMIGNDERLQVKVFYREFRMTVRQIVERFGRNPDNPREIDWTNISEYVRTQWQNDYPEAWVDVAHVIMPNPEYDPERLEARFKRYLSYYYERGYAGKPGNDYMPGGLDDKKFLMRSGYDFFPVLVPRWEVTGEDVYGTDCPGMQALGDIRQLQFMEKRVAQAIEKMVNPPMVAPTSLRSQKTTILPGDITYVDEREGQKGFRAAHEINFRMAEAEQKMQQIRQRIQLAFFEPLFLNLIFSDRRQITAREIEERHEEKLLQLGPMLERLNQELLDPLIDITFTFMLRQGLVPEPPEEIQGQDLKVEYISIMSQAQKLIGLAGIERTIGFASQLAAISPQVFDKISIDQVMDEYADILGVPPTIMMGDDEVAEIRARRAEAAQAQVLAAAVPQLAKAAKDLSGAKLEGDNALTRIAGA